jgi:predicted PurR-regulated permease PerM
LQPNILQECIVSGTRSLVTAAAVIVLVYGMQAAQEILVPFLTAAFLAVIVARPVYWLDRRGVPHVLSVTTVMILLVAVAALASAYVGVEITQFTTRLPAYQESLSQSLSALVSRFSTRRIPVRVEELMGEIEPGQAMRYTAMILNGLKDVFANAVLISFTIVFILLEIPSLPEKLARVVPHSDATLRRFRTFADGLQRYLNLKTLISLATGLCVGVWVAILDVDFPILWGLLAFLLNYIPNIGSLIAAVPAILMGFIQYGLGRAIMVSIGYLVVNMTFGNVIEPRVMGRGLGLSTLVVWLSLIVWGWALGPIGMLLSVPLTMTIKIALESSRKTRRWAVLLKSNDAIDEDEAPAGAAP